MQEVRGLPPQIPAEPTFFALICSLHFHREDADLLECLEVFAAQRINFTMVSVCKVGICPSRLQKKIVRSTERDQSSFDGVLPVFDTCCCPQAL
jgi:hypothetical protein